MKGSIPSTQWLLLFITNTPHWVNCINPNVPKERFDYQPLPTSVETTSVLLGVDMIGVDIEAVSHQASTINLPH